MSVSSRFFLAAGAIGSFAAFLPSALAQNPPGQVRMQIPLGNQPTAQAPPGQPPPRGAPPGGIGAAGNRPGQPALPPASGMATPAPVSQVFSSEAGMDALLTEEVIRALRDPFSPPAIITKKEEPKTELELIELKDLKLNGVITGPRKVRAMLTAANKTFFVAVGDKVGTRQGRITSIQSDLIKVVEYDTDDRGRKVPEIFEVRITGEIVSLSKKEE